MITDFFGNRAVVETLETMISGHRIPQTILLSGPEGVGKATLVRRFAAALLPNPEQISKDDLASEDNLELLADREKLPSEKRAEDPLLFNSHPDFVTSETPQSSIHRPRTLSCLPDRLKNIRWAGCVHFPKK